jgi:glycogen debranching enzyme
MWPTLEREMIMEVARGQTASGRIPVTVLPIIDRGDEIDTSEYFVLNIARYYHWYRDRELVRQTWPAIKRAIAYLSSRDVEHIGAPMQASFWADWKDVSGVQGRKYAPEFDLLWIAALRAAAELAPIASDTQAADEYRRAAIKAEAFVNRPVEQGGLWNGRYYVEQWPDGPRSGLVLEDQLVGAWFDVIPADRLQSIYASLAANRTRWGVRETFPYRIGWGEESGGTPGNYHNGGIWPYVNFMDAGGRYANGQAETAEQIIREVGRADLDEGDDRPSEYLNGDDGSNRKFSILLDDADLFSTLYFKALGLTRVDDSTFEIRVHLPERRDFSTRLILPVGPIRLSSRSGRLDWHWELSSARRPHIAVHVIDERPSRSVLVQPVVTSSRIGVAL